MLIEPLMHDSRRVRTANTFSIVCENRRITSTVQSSCRIVCVCVLCEENIVVVGAVFACVCVFVEAHSPA